MIFFSDMEQATLPPSQLAVVSPASPATVPALEKEIKPYRCSICTRGFNNEIGLQNHLWSHLPPGRRILTSTDNNSQLQRYVRPLFPYLHTSYKFAMSVCAFTTAGFVPFLLLSL